MLSWHGTPYRVFIAIGHGLCARHGGGQHSIEGVEHLSGTLFRFFCFFFGVATLNSNFGPFFPNPAA